MHSISRFDSLKLFSERSTFEIKNLAGTGLLKLHLYQYNIKDKT